MIWKSNHKIFEAFDMHTSKHLPRHTIYRKLSQ